MVVPPVKPAAIDDPVLHGQQKHKKVAQKFHNQHLTLIHREILKRPSANLHKRMPGRTGEASELKRPHCTREDLDVDDAGWRTCHTKLPLAAWEGMVKAVERKR